MNRRGFLQLAAAAPLAAAVPQAASAAISGKAIAMRAGLGNSMMEPYYEKGLAYAEDATYGAIRNLNSLLGAARMVMWKKGRWAEAYRRYRESRWQKPADFRDRDCRVIWRRFGEDKMLSKPQQEREWGAERELMSLQKKWQRMPDWLKELARRESAKRETGNMINRGFGQTERAQSA